MRGRIDEELRTGFATGMAGRSPGGMARRIADQEQELSAIARETDVLRNRLRALASAIEEMDGADDPWHH